MNNMKGLLLVQLGSPAELNSEKIGEYLYEFLGDWHTMGKRLFFWKFVLRHFILPKGKFTSYGKYKRMFDHNGFAEMPLITHSRNFLAAVQKALPDVQVELAYQYGCKPSIQDALESFTSKGISTVHVLPLYPQRSGVTTDAAIDNVLDVARRIRFSGKLLCADGFCFSSAWVRAVSETIKPYVDESSTLVLSWHSVQSWRIEKGDPYEKDCEQSSRDIGMLLGVTPVIAYQSKFGDGKWLGPSLIETVTKLGRENKPVVIACPAFTVDNLETIYEIDDEISEIYKNAGGTSLKRVPCLNADPAWIKALVEEILPNLKFVERN